MCLKATPDDCNRRSDHDIDGVDVGGVQGGICSTRDREGTALRAGDLRTRVVDALGVRNARRHIESKKRLRRAVQCKLVSAYEHRILQRFEGTAAGQAIGSARRIGAGAEVGVEVYGAGWQFL